MCWKRVSGDIHFYWGRHTQDLYEEELVLEWCAGIRSLRSPPYCPKRPRPKPRIIAAAGA